MAMLRIAIISHGRSNWERWLIKKNPRIPSFIFFLPARPRSLIIRSHPLFWDLLRADNSKWVEYSRGFFCPHPTSLLWQKLHLSFPNRQRVRDYLILHLGDSCSFGHSLPLFSDLVSAVFSSGRRCSILRMNPGLVFCNPPPPHVSP